MPCSSVPSLSLAYPNALAGNRYERDAAFIWPILHALHRLPSTPGSSRYDNPARVMVHTHTHLLASARQLELPANAPAGPNPFFTASGATKPLRSREGFLRAKKKETEKRVMPTGTAREGTYYSAPEYQSPFILWCEHEMAVIFTAGAVRKLGA